MAKINNGKMNAESLLFLRFLKDNNIYYDFLYNFNEQNPPLIWYEFLHKTHVRDYIIRAFCWEDTLEGYYFWNSYYTKWLKLLMKKVYFLVK